MTNSAQGTVTLRKLRNGATSAVALNVDKQLLQLVAINDATGNATVAPDWSQSANQPTITPTLIGGSGMSLSDVRWYYNGDIYIGNIESGSSNANFRINSNDGSLTIINNLGSKDNLSTDTVTMKAEIIDSTGLTSGNVEKTIDIPIQRVSTSGYTVLIDSTGTVLGTTASGSVNNSTTLTAKVLQGTADVTDSVTVKFYKGNTDTAVSTGKTLTVTRDDVDGAQLYIARAFVGSVEVDAEGITIIDSADEYQIIMSCAAGTDSQNNVTNYNVPASATQTVVTATVQKNGITVTATSWVTSKFHADTQKLIAEVAEQTDYTTDSTVQDSYNTASTNSITVYDKDYVSSSSGPQKRSEVIVLAQCNI